MLVSPHYADPTYLNINEIKISITPYGKGQLHPTMQISTTQGKISSFSSMCDPNTECKSHLLEKR